MAVRMAVVHMTEMARAGDLSFSVTSSIPGIGGARPYSGSAPVNATCELNPQCDALNLEGVCCPSKLPVGRDDAFYTSTTTAHLSHR